MSHYFHVERASTSLSTPSDLLTRQSPKEISLLHLNFLLIRWDNVCIVFLPQTQKKIFDPNGFRIISANAPTAPVLPMHIFTRSETKTGSKVD